MKDEKIQNYYKAFANDYMSNTEHDLLNQVGKTYLGKTISKEVFSKIINSILENLDIQKSDTVLDLGCANGLVSNYISQHAKHVYGFDLSEALVEVALKYNDNANTTFQNQNILDINFNAYPTHKLYMYEVLQFFDSAKLRQLLNRLANAYETFSFFIGSIPDSEKILDFYHTKERQKYYFDEVLENGKFHLGNWWYKEQVMYLCEDLNLQCKIIEQDASLHTAHYRFDCLIEKR